MIPVLSSHQSSNVLLQAMTISSPVFPTAASCRSIKTVVATIQSTTHNQINTWIRVSQTVQETDWRKSFGTLALNFEPQRRK